jgi:diketogulonate reductase-like aldo/keto reductase
MSLMTHNQVPVPNFMYGTAWKKDATTKLVVQAVQAGFTAIDTANQPKHYSEPLVGEALKELQKQGIKRESLFVQTKFTPADGQDHRKPYDASASLTKQVQQSMDSSLEHLHTDYVDSYVLHGPYSRYGLGAEDWEVWRAIEAHYQAGKTRMIGISNVTAQQLRDLCAAAKTKPMMVQNRCYAAMGWDQEVREICREHNIIYQGFSLLTANSREMSAESIRSIAGKLKATVAQVIFRFSMQIGMLPLTGTTSEQHMKEDLLAEKLLLSPEDIKTIESISARSMKW